jgi:uncharacterized caspase-like protein
MGASKDDLSAILIAVRNDVMKETQRKQVPWEHSALTGRFYFGGPAPSGPTPDEISWALIRETSDPALLWRFVAQFPDSKRRKEAEQLATELAAKMPAPPEKTEQPPQPAPVPVAAPRTPADEIAWALIKETKDPALLRRFVEQFPDSEKRPDAEKLAAALASAPRPATPSEKKAPSGNRNCFSFDGRQFCK